MHDTSDAAVHQLVQDFLKTRSETAFRALYRMHTPVLYRVAARLIHRDPVATEDVIQEVWIRAVEHLNEFRWESSLRTWLTGITINCCKEHQRKSMTNHDAETEHITYSEQPALDASIDLHEALCQLPNGYREILVLHDFEGYKHHEIGLILGVSEGTSKSQLFNARLAMRKLMNERL